MTARDVFAERFTLLRNTYHNTYKELGYILGVNSNSITEWAKSRRNFPDPDKLLVLADIYGVSIDWLFGRTNIVYNDSILTRIEDTHTINMLSPVIDIPNTYLNINERKHNYSKGVRGNIIAITYVTQFSALAQALGNDFYKNPDYAKLIVMNTIKIRNIMNDLLVSQDNIVYRLLTGNKREPAFDVEYAFSQII
ncbi:MAG: helix-turn-helix transcriptional regulator [Acidaminococcaceae bacterium]|nr:helix-turn-helix transcriptional regulator [Acidaminococcaceae bacterium]